MFVVHRQKLTAREKLISDALERYIRCKAMAELVICDEIDRASEEAEATMYDLIESDPPFSNDELLHACHLHLSRDE